MNFIPFNERVSLVVKQAPGCPRKVQQVPGSSLEVVLAEGSKYHKCRAFSGVAAGRCESVSKAKTFAGRVYVTKGSKEATSLQEKHHGQTRSKSFSLMNSLSDCSGTWKKLLHANSKVS